MAINEFHAPSSPIDAIAKALSVAHSVYGIKQAANASDLAQAQLAQAQQKTSQDSTTFKQSQDQYGKLSDPNSAESKQAQLESGLALDFAAKHNYTDSGHASKLKALINGTPDSQDESGNVIPGTPGMSALSLSKNPEISPFLALIKGQQSADAMANKNATQAGRLEETKSQNSIKAGDEFENDPIIKLSKTSLNSLKKSLSILSDTSKPVTTKDLNLAYNDYINSVAAGGAATEGKINRELPETWEQTWNDFKQKSGKSGDAIDLRKTPVGANLIDMLTKNISNVQRDMKDQIATQAVNRYDNYSQTGNDKVKEIAKSKLKTYAPDYYAAKFGGGSLAPAAPSSDKPAGGLIPSANAGESATPDMTPDVISYAKKHGISNEQALSIKQQRGGK